MQSIYGGVSPVTHCGQGYQDYHWEQLVSIREVTALDPWCCTSGQVRKALGEEQAEVPAQDEWRLVYLGKLLAERDEWHYELRDTSELTELIDSLCVN